MKVILIALATVGGFFALILLAWLLFLGGKIGPANVSEQWRFAYDYDQSLRAIARQICTADDAVQAATTSDEATQRRSQLIAYEQNYERVAAEYNAHLKDAFRAGIIRPADVPDQAPTQGEMRLEECP